MKIREDVASLLWMLAAGALMGVVVVAMLDPACGPTGYEQDRWMMELFNDTATEAK